MGMRRRGAAVLAGLALGAATLAAGATPAATAPADSDTLVFVPERGGTVATVRNGVTTTATYWGEESFARAYEGDFTSAPGTDVFVYRPGPEPDGIVTVTPDGDGVTTALIPKTVNGSYGPLIGDFDGNGVDDVLWYQASTAGDSLWLFEEDGSHRNVPLTVNNAYLPTVIDANGDGHDDVLWYGWGKAHDHLWLFGAGGSHTSRVLRIDGKYQIVAGRFGDRPAGSPQERLVFHSDPGYDSIWTFDADAGHTSAPLPPIDGGFTPVVGRFTDPGRDAITWFQSAAADRLWSFTAAGTVVEVPSPQIDGLRDPVVADVDGNGYQDIAWHHQGQATVWRFDGTGHAEATVDSGLRDTILAAGHTDPADR